MGKERGGRMASAPVSAVSAPKGRAADELSLDPQKIVKLWRKGKRKMALDNINKLIKKSPTPVRRPPTFLLPCSCLPAFI
jgi:hypothetical protein